jgi:hypothetical protein
MSMKKKSTSKTGRKTGDELRAEYDFDYRKARPNRFAGRAAKNQIAVVLEPDIARVFNTSESVNRVLRALIESMPKGKSAKTSKPSGSQ